MQTGPIAGSSNHDGSSGGYFHQIRKRSEKADELLSEGTGQRIPVLQHLCPIYKTFIQYYAWEIHVWMELKTDFKAAEHISSIHGCVLLVTQNCNPCMYCIKTRTRIKLNNPPLKNFSHPRASFCYVVQKDVGIYAD